VVVTALCGLARILATAFAPPLQTHANGTRALLVGVGAVTAVIGASGCFEQRHVKRLLAFVTVSQVGLILCGIGLLGDRALAGAALAALATGLVLAALFGVVGVLLRRYQTADEYELAGRGRDLPFAACVFAIGALLLVPLPPGVGFRGVALIATAARSDGYTWLPILLAVTSAVSAGTLLRAGGRVFLGLGVQRKPEQRDANEDRSQEQSSDEEEAPKEGRRTSPVLIAVPALLLALAVVLGVLPGFAASVEAAAAHFRDVQSYTAAVLRAKSPHYAPVAGTAIGTAPWLYSAASLVGAVLVATTGLRGRGLLPTQIVDALRGAHSGHVGDYVAWWTFGLATFGALALWAIAG
jgi:multicomponent Na+:H+ antiporter subunit D